MKLAHKRKMLSILLTAGMILQNVTSTGSLIYASEESSSYEETQASSAGDPSVQDSDLTTPTQPEETAAPTEAPTPAPTQPEETAAPTEAPTPAPTQPEETAAPTEAPTPAPTQPEETAAPTEAPTPAATQPEETAAPTEAPVYELEEMVSDVKIGVGLADGSAFTDGSYVKVEEVKDTGLDTDAESILYRQIFDLAIEEYVSAYKEAHPELAEAEPDEAKLDSLLTEQIEEAVLTFLPWQVTVYHADGTEYSEDTVYLTSFTVENKKRAEAENQYDVLAYELKDEKLTATIVEDDPEDPSDDGIITVTKDAEKTCLQYRQTAAEYLAVVEYDTDWAPELPTEEDNQANLLANEAANQCGDNLYWEIVGNELVISGSGEMWDFVDGKQQPWEASLNQIETVSIGEEVTSIGAWAFANSSSIREINIPDNVTSLGEGAFGYCSSLLSVHIGNGVTSLPDFLLSGDDTLEELVIGDGVTEIPGGLLGTNTSLKRLTIGNGVKELTWGQFLYYYSEDDWQTVKFKSGLPSLEEVTLGSGLTTIGGQAFYGAEKLTSIVIPDSCTKIDHRAFEGCTSLKELTIPNSVTEIGAQIFSGSGLETLTIGSGVENIPDGAFGSLKTLKTVNIGSGVKSIGAGAFYGCSLLETVNFGDESQVAEIKSGAFGDCDNLKEIVLPDSVTTISNSIFGKRGVETLTLGAGLKELPEAAFGGMSDLKTVNIGPGVEIIGVSAFKDCDNLENVNFGEDSHVKDMKRGAFADCDSLKKIVLPDSQTSIDLSVFSYSKNLETIVFGDGIKTIPTGTISALESLKYIAFGKGVEVVEPNAVTSCPALKMVIFSEKASTVAEDFIYFSYDYDSDELIVCGFADTGAQEYAKKKDLKFAAYVDPKGKETIADAEEYASPRYFWTVPEETRDYNMSAWNGTKYSENYYGSWSSIAKSYLTVYEMDDQTRLGSFSQPVSLEEGKLYLIHASGTYSGDNRVVRAAMKSYWSFGIYDKVSGQAVEGLKWELYKYSNYTTLLAQGETAADGFCKFEPDMLSSGTYYLKVSEIPDDYAEGPEWRTTVKWENETRYETVKCFLTPFAQDKLSVTVCDGDTKLAGFELTVYEYSKELGGYKTEPYLVLTDNGDGTYSLPEGEILLETADNAGKFQIVNTGATDGYMTGNTAIVTISGLYDETVHARIDMSSLLSVLKKDAQGDWIGTITLKYNDKVIASTDPNVKIEYYSSIPATSTIVVECSGMQIDETRVVEGKRYTYDLPNELVPVLDATEKDGVLGGTPTALTQIGKVSAEGSIAEVSEGSGEYRLEIVFRDLKGEYNIEMGYTYEATINEENQDDGTVTATWPIDKTLSFKVTLPEVSSDKLVTLSKSLSYQNADRITAVTTIYNHQQDKMLTADLKEEIPDNTVMLIDRIRPYEALQVSVDGRSYSLNFQRPSAHEWKYVSNDGKIVATLKDVNWYEYSSYPSDYSGENYIFTKTFLTLKIKDLECEKVELRYYVSPYYNEDVKGNYSTSYVGESTLQVEGLTEDQYDTEKTTGTGNSYYSNGGHVSASINDYAKYTTDSSYKNVDKTTAAIFNFFCYSVPYESWFEFTEKPYLSEPGSNNYYFNSADFNWEGWLGNSLEIQVNGTTILGENSTRSSHTSNPYYATSSTSYCRLTALNMRQYDPKAWMELMQLFEDEADTNINPNSRISISGYKNPDAIYREPIISYRRTDGRGYYTIEVGQLPVYGYRYGNNYYWVVVSPDTLGLSKEGDQNGGPYGTIRNNQTGLPEGVRVYILGLNGGESVNIKYTKHQRTITLSSQRVSMSSGGSPSYGGAGVVSEYRCRTRYNTSTSTGGTNDSACNDANLSATTEVMEDGSIKVILTLDASRLAYLYKTPGRYPSTSSTGQANGYYWQAQVGTAMAARSLLYVTVPSGYKLSSQSASSNSGMLRIYMQENVTGSPANEAFIPFYFQYSPSSTEASSWGEALMPKILPNKRYDRVVSISTAAMLQEMYWDSDLHKYVIKMYYVLEPDGKSLSNSTGGSEIYTSAELITAFPSYHNGSPDGDDLSIGCFMDTAAAAWAAIPNVSSKSIQPKTDTAQKNDWVNKVEVDLVNSSPNGSPNGSTSFVSGTIALQDNMQNTKILDKNGEELDIKDAAKYIKLKSIRYILYRKSGASYDDGIAIEGGNVIAEGDKISLMALQNSSGSLVPKFGFKRYESVKNGITFHVDYAPQRTTYLESDDSIYTSLNGVHYGGNYYGMNGGIEVYVSGVKNGTHLTLIYDTYFDYEAFAADYPELGEVTIEVGNTAKRGYSRYPSDSVSVSASDGSFTYSVQPDLTKELISEEDASLETNTYGYHKKYLTKAYIGGQPQNSVYIMDQITAVTEGGSQYTPEQIAELLKYVNVNIESITAKNEVDLSKSEDVFKDGEWSKDWSWTSVAVPEGIDLSRIPEAYELNGNLFCYQVQKTNGDPIEASTYFEIQYTFSLDKTVDGKNFRKLAFYGGGILMISSQAAIAYPVIAKGEDETPEGDVTGRASATPDTEWVAAGASVEKIPYLAEPMGIKSPLVVNTTDDGSKSVTTWVLGNEFYTAGKNDIISDSFSDTIRRLTANQKDDDLNEKLIKALLECTTVDNYRVYVYTSPYPKLSPNYADSEWAEPGAKKIELVKQGGARFTDGNGRRVVISPTIPVYSYEYTPLAELTEEDKEAGLKTGYADCTLFLVSVSGLNYDEEVDIVYDVTIDWVSFYNKAKAFLNKKFTMDDLNKLKFTYTNTSDGPGTPEADSSWEYPAELNGSLKKTGEVNAEDRNAIDWTIAASVGGVSFSDFILTDGLKADDSITDEALVANNEIARKNMSVISFSIEDGEGNVLYTAEDFSKGTEIVIPDQVADPDSGKKDIWTGAVLTFTDEGFSLAFGELKSGSNVVIRYTTKLDVEAFADAGGDLTKAVTVSNAALGKTDNYSLESNRTVETEPQENERYGIEKEEVKGGLLKETGWKVTADIGSFDATTAKITDTLVAPDEISAYLSLKTMKVTLRSRAEGTETEGTETEGTETEGTETEGTETETVGTVIYDSAEGIDLLADYGFRFGDGFALNENGKYDFTLYFNQDEEGKAADEDRKLEKNTQIVVEYVTSLDEDAYLENGGTVGDFDLTNNASLSRNGFDDVDTTAPGSVYVWDAVKKEGTALDETDEEGNPVTEWSIKLYLNQFYTKEELADAKDVVITDRLTSTRLLKYVENSVHIYELSDSGTRGEELSSGLYGVEPIGKRVIITLDNPADHPNIEVVLRTSSPSGVDSISNRVEVSILGKDFSDESEDVEIPYEEAGYIKSDQFTAELEVVKTDADTNAKLAGAVFRLYTVNGTEEKPVDHIVKLGSGYVYDELEDERFWIYDLVTAESGVLYIDKLPYGDYVLKEVAAPEGYALDSEPIYFTIDQSCFEKNGDVYYFKGVKLPDGSYQTEEEPMTVTNTAIEFQAYKFYEEEIADTTYTGGVRGAKLQIWTTDESSMLMEGTTDENGYVTFTHLPVGTYLLVEDVAPGSFYMAANIEFTVNVDGTITVAAENSGIDEDGRVFIKMQDELVTGRIQITKFGQVVHDLGWTSKLVNTMVHIFEWITGNLSDVTFDVYAAEDIKIQERVIFAKDTKIISITTNESGSAELPNLPQGSYYVIESAAGDDYVLKSDPIRFVLVPGYDENLKPILTCYGNDVVVNDRRTVRINLMKTDEETKEPLENAVFGLYAAKDESIFTKDDLLDIAVSGADGAAMFTVSLPVGEYYIQEISAPLGYVLSEQKYEVTFDKDTETNTVIEVEATNQSRKLSINKVDENGDPVEGSQLALVDSVGEEVERWTSGLQAHVITGIVPGTYTLKELKAPDGYVYANDITITVTEDEVNQTVTMVDKRTEVKIAKKDSETKEPVVGAELMLNNKTTGKLVESWTSDGSVHVIKGKLVAGETYILTELTAPDGYGYADPIEFTVSKDGTVDEVEMLDVKTKVSVSKVDAKSGKPLAGATIQILDPNGGIVAKWVSTEEPYTVSGLKVGVVYTLKETEAPEGYELAEAVTFRFDMSGEIDINKTTADMQDGVLLIRDVATEEETSEEETSEEETSEEKTSEEETSEEETTEEVTSEDETTASETTAPETTAPETTKETSSESESTVPSSSDNKILGIEDHSGLWGTLLITLGGILMFAAVAELLIQLRKRNNQSQKK